MLRNLKAEMARHGIKTIDLQRAISKTDRCIRDKISGRAVFTLSEAMKIRDTYFKGLDLDYLFATSLDNDAS